MNNISYEDMIFLLKKDIENNSLIVMRQEVDDLVEKSLVKFKDTLFKDDSYEYSVIDFEKIITLLDEFNPEIIQSNTKELNKQYCYDLSAAEYSNIKYIKYLKIYKDFLKNNRKVNKKELIDSIFREIGKNYDEKKHFSSAIKLFIELCYKELYYIGKISNIISFEKNNKDKSVIFFSHRKKGFNTENILSCHQLNIKVCTNFGYGRKSYIQVKVFFKGHEIVNSYLEKESIYYNSLFEVTSPQNETWLDAMIFIKNITNFYSSNHIDFLKKILLENINEQILLLEDSNNNYIHRFHGYDFMTRNTQLLFCRADKIFDISLHLKNILEYKEQIDLGSYISRMQLVIEHLVCKLEEHLIEEHLKTLENESSELKDISKKIDELKIVYNEISI